MYFIKSEEHVILSSWANLLLWRKNSWHICDIILAMKVSVLINIKMIFIYSKIIWLIRIKYIIKTNHYCPEIQYNHIDFFGLLKYDKRVNHLIDRPFRLVSDERYTRSTSRGNPLPRFTVTRKCSVRKRKKIGESTTRRSIDDILVTYRDRWAPHTSTVGRDTG